ncbi:hypothetical protein POM88_019183 [Heracleum sosnowskyi]|uniref:Protein kinase domain-containing protein n=1 Tax=Heracleum sosnowskyi TaxID=360622 RepID=A0AAD8MVE1_9APIA|nr:hypothetical protein POM88_019183 [Heracleum sosnowskyi]
MNCLPCFTSSISDEEDEGKLPVAQVQAPLLSETDNGDIAAKAFTFREMAVATKNFRQESVLFDDGFGRVFKGTLKSTGEVVAVKQLDRNGISGNKEFLDEVKTLSPLKHPNLINLIGYCADGEQRLLVYEHMPLGSLETHLLDRPAENSPLDWITRMKIATGAAEEYARTGELTMKSDIYSFGVVLLELITGRRAIDPNRPANEQNLVTWAQPIFRDPKRFPEMADPFLNDKFSVKSLNQAVGVAAMCLQEEPMVRPYITDVVAALSFLEFDAKDPPAPAVSADEESFKENNESECSRYSDEDDNDHIDSRHDINSSEHEDNDNISETHDNDHHSISLDEEEDNNNINETDDEITNSSMNDEDEETALTIEFDHEHSPSENLTEEEYSGDEEYDDAENEPKSIKSTNSKKAKMMELSEDESIYSSGSLRSSSSSKKDEITAKKSTNKTVQRVKSKLKSNLRHAGPKKIKNRWRKAKTVLHNKPKK